MITLVDQLNATSPGNHHGWLGFTTLALHSYWAATDSGRPSP